MSTIVAVRKDGIAVIGADTLTKFGSTKQSVDLLKNFSKIMAFGENYLSHVGDVAFGHAIKSFLAQQTKLPTLDSPQNIFEFACVLHKALKNDYFLKPYKDENDDFESSRFESLIVNPHGIFGLYALRSVDEFSKYHSFGTGYRYALGAMRTIYPTGATAEEIALAGLEAAADFDDGTDRPLEIFKVKLLGEKG